MSHTAATADRPLLPDPAPDRSAGKTSVPEGIARLLTVLRWLIGYGQQLAADLQQRVVGDGLLDLVHRRYRTGDLAVILARIRRGLMLAAGLEGKLVKRAATGRDVVPVPVRTSKPTSRGDNPSRRRKIRHINIIDLPLDRLPTAEEIAAELRRRPIGAVLADICRDLGIVPNDLPRELRQQLRDCVMDYGGWLSVMLFEDDKIRLRAMVEAALLPPPMPLAPVLAASATGPP